MEQCAFCGASMAAEAGFCGNCGRAPSHSSEHATIAGDLPTFPQRNDTSGESRATLLASPDADALANAPTSLLSVEEAETREEDDEKKRRNAALLGLGLLGSLPDQQAVPQMPGIAGTPQMAQMPGIAGTPQLPGGTGGIAGGPATPSPVINPMTNPPMYNPPSWPGGSPSGGYPGGSTPGGSPGGSPGGTSAGGAGCLPIVAIIVATVLLILASVVGLGLTVWSPNLSLGGSSSLVNPGNTLTIHGTNFLFNSDITLTLDDGSIPMVRQGTAGQLASRGQLALFSTAAPKMVKADSSGEFTAQIYIDPTWTKGQHVIHATESPSHRSASLGFTISDGSVTTTPTTTSLTPTLIPTTTPTATATVAPPDLSCAQPGTLALGTISEYSSQAANGSITLCASGSGTVNWTASWNQNQAGWLELDTTAGTIQAPGQVNIGVIGSAANLGAGTYSADVTFSNQDSQTVETVTVTLTVKAGCVTLAPKRLSFAGVAGTNDPAAQTITVTNCGLTSDWTASASTGSGGNWLGLDYTQGSLNSGTTGQLTVSASNIKTKLAAGTYQGTITVKFGSQSATVSVVLTVQAAPTLSASPGTLNYLSCSAKAGSYYCSVTLTNNSSSVPLTWSAQASLTNVSVQAGTYTIAAGGTVQATVVIPAGDCQSSLTVTFSGPANSVPVGWFCEVIG